MLYEVITLDLFLVTQGDDFMGRPLALQGDPASHHVADRLGERLVADAGAA